MNLIEIWCEGVDCIQLAQKRVTLFAFVNAVMNFLVS
jgi:hypothetical protein